MAAGYALPGAYERLYFYYAYRLDHLTSEKPIIAVGCKGKDGGLCGLNEFMEYISKKKVTASVTNDLHPEIEATAQKIFEKEELTAQVEFKKVVQSAKNEYADVFKKVGDRFVGKLDPDTEPLDRPPKDKKGNLEPETAEQTAARKAQALEDVKLCRQRGYDSMHKVFKARVEAAVDAMVKLHPDWKIEAPLSKDGVPIFNLKKTVKANPTVSEGDIAAAWLENIKGGHKENIKTLKGNLDGAEVLGFCLPGGALRMAKRQITACKKFPIEDEILFPKEAKLGKAAQMAEEISEAEFEKLATQKGLKKLAQEKWKGTTLADVRTKLHYEKLTSESPKVSVGKGGGFKAPSVASGIGEVVGIGLWVYGIVEAWRDNVSGLELGAAASSIIPIVGCTVQAIADHAKGAFETIDTALCLLGDGLMLTGNVPAGIALHVIRAILSFFRPPPYPKLEHMQAARDGVWNRFLKDDIYSYIYSHPGYANITGRRVNSTEVDFRDKLEGALAMEGLAVLSHGAQTIGAAVASAQDSLEASTTPEQKADVEKAIADVKTQLLEATDREMVRRQRQMLIALPKTLKETHDISLQPIADEFNRQFNDNITSSEMVEKYHKWLFMGFGAATEDNQEEVERDLGKIADALYANPPQLPSYFDLTYILGQSRGLANIHNDTLSIPSYLRDKFPTMSEASLQVHVLHHTLQIANLIMRTNTEDKLSQYFPDSDAQGVRDLQTLIALKFGRISDESKLWVARLDYPEGNWAWMLTEEDFRAARAIVNPYVPQCRPQIVAPQPKPLCTPLLTGPASIFLTIGMSKALVASLSEQERALTTRGVSEVSQKIKDLARKLEADVTTPKRFWHAMLAAQKAKDDEDAAFLALPAGPPKEGEKPVRRALPRSAAVYRANFGASL
ncbi:hypothetical protein ISF_05579 [Cordyceps fumosorosea ARSEF 2679]|uniref:Heat-labile enterotoxin, A chain n=1 Tax=Cordyceps fumosorosea (strain ARSEF 2679) TaxID=1081104 RepID=A0A167UEB4_CORFA|nr:hypothetical protein ISF_05579 [Cordyceps fumosorosea ARSEF 2679]OAA61500.1 hypothetical protein ISF_05579 [Cordyceps fumosorosea ARSEF 2679]